MVRVEESTPTKKKTPCNLINVLGISEQSMIICVTVDYKIFLPDFTNMYICI